MTTRLTLDTIKGDVKGYIALWGDVDQKDFYDTWFDIKNPPEMGLDFLPFPIFYEHAGDATVRHEVVGKVVKVSWDDKGIAFEGVLDRSNSFFDRIASEIMAGELFTSSGSTPHLADFDEDGRFVKWFLSELSFTKTPAEERMPAVSIIRTAHQKKSGNDLGVAAEPIKSNLLNGVFDMTTVKDLKRKLAKRKKAKRDLADLEEQGVADASLATVVDELIDEFGEEEVIEVLEQLEQGELDPEFGERALDDEDEADEVIEDEADVEIVEDAVTDLDEVVEDLKDLLRAELRKRKRRAKRSRGTVPAARTAQQQRQSAAPTTPVAPVRNTAARSADILVSSKYDHLTASEMALGYSLLRSKNKGASGHPVSETYLKAMAAKVQHLRAQGDAAANDPVVTRSFRYTRANEVMTSDITGDGAEWVYDYHSTSLWHQIRQETPIYQRMLALGMDEAEIPQGWEGETLPLEGIDPTWYVAKAATDIDTSSGQATPTFAGSKFGTGKREVNVAKLSTMITFQKEFEEDSIIPILAETNRKIQLSGVEQVEHILLSGDTSVTANTNINLGDGTPAGPPTQPAYTLLDGIMKVPLVTNAANSRDAGNQLSELDFLRLLPLLGPDGKYAADLNRVMYVIDNHVYFAALNIASMKTRDVFANATIENGVLTRMWGIEVLRSGQLKLAGANGKVSATAANNTQGRITLIRPDQFVSRWKRRMTTSVTYLPYSDTTQVVAHLRWGLAYRDQDAAAISYNVATQI